MRTFHISKIRTFVAFLTVASCFGQTAERHVYKARAVLKGAPGSNINGIVTLTQVKPGVVSEVFVDAQITGLQPGALHGMHIHEVGNCSDVNPVNGSVGAFAGAGGHFDPGPNSNSNADLNHPFHMGDVPNVVVSELGVGALKHRTSRITLAPGPLSVFDADNPATPFDDSGSAIVLHADPDQGTTGVAGGAGGARIACGVIERISGWEEQASK
jgi:Cu-Zn family superoxide dismutase